VARRPVAHYLLRYPRLAFSCCQLAPWQISSWRKPIIIHLHASCRRPHLHVAYIPPLRLSSLAVYCPSRSIVPCGLLSLSLVGNYPSQSIPCGVIAFTGYYPSRAIISRCQLSIAVYHLSWFIIPCGLLSLLSPLKKVGWHPKRLCRRVAWL